MELAAAFEILFMYQADKKNCERLDDKNPKNKYFPRESIPLMLQDVERWRNEKNSLICHVQNLLPLFLRSDVLSLLLGFSAVDFVLADLEYN
jgi:hypothetical protein